MLSPDDLDACIEANDLTLFRHWLENGGDPNAVIARPGFEGTSVLLHVLMNIDEPATDEPILEMMRLLIEKGADVNAREEDGYSPLHWVITESRAEMAKMLLEAGASVNYKMSDGEHPLIRAMESNAWDLMAVLLQYASLETINQWGGVWCNTPLGMAFRTLNFPMIELLLKHGADPYAYDPDEYSTINNIPKLDAETEMKIYDLLEKYGWPRPQ